MASGTLNLCPVRSTRHLPTLRPQWTQLFRVQIDHGPMRKVTWNGRRQRGQSQY